MSISSGNQPHAQSGVMVGVHGQIFKNDKVVCTFKARTGDANNATKILVLHDDVQIDSAEPHATLLCDKLVYVGNEKFFKATGHVRVLGTMGTMGTLEEVWATPDLSKIASPDLFRKP